jgi:4-amino-4-deoxy-L-arabinose transferase-like glycosyltransferase
MIQSFISKLSIDRTPVAWTLLLAGIWLAFFLRLGTPPLFDWDEGAFSEATREMLVSGDWISITLNGAPRYDKPVLIHWLQAASVSLLGSSEFAFRLPSTLAASAWVIVIYGFGRTFFNHRVGWFAAWMAIASLPVCLIGRAATADAWLNLLLTASMYTALRFYRDEKMRWLYGTFALSALGFLTKGPIAVLVPVAVTLIHCILLRRTGVWLRGIFSPIGILIFAVIALPWYALRTAEAGRAFIDGFFLLHNVGRFQGPMQGHAGSLLYYVPIVLLAVFPFTAIAIGVLIRVRAYWQDQTSRFLLLWFLFVVSFFSLSGTKLPHYVLYGLPGLLLLMARELEFFKSYQWVFGPAVVIFGLLFFLPEFLVVAVSKIHNPLQEALWVDADLSFAVAYRGWLVFVALLCLSMSFRFWLPARSVALAIGLVVPFTVGFWIVPKVGDIQQQPIKEAAQMVRQHAWPVAQWDLHLPSFSVYAEQVIRKRPLQPGEVALVLYSKHGGDPGYDVVFKDRGIALLRKTEGN